MSGSILLRRLPVIAVIGTVGVMAAACGTTTSDTSMSGMNHSSAAATTIATRTVDITMTDIRFSVAKVDVTTGETVKFVFHNEGKLVHEAVIGDAALQDAHETQMGATGGGMAMGGSGEVSVEAGKSGELMYTFRNAGPLLIGCHQPGHYAAGMKIDVGVA